MTQERINAIAEVLNADEERAKKLIDMEPADAAEALKAEGYDFTADELIEFGEIVAKANQAGELDESKLDNVAGGVIAAGVAIAAGLAGYWLARRW